MRPKAQNLLHLWILTAAAMIGPVAVSARAASHILVVGRFLTKPQLKTSPVTTPRDPVEAKFIQVFPWRNEEFTFRRSQGIVQAVVLIHGLQVQPFTTFNVNRASLQGWQTPESKLVKALSVNADVYAFAYNQKVTIEEVAAVPNFADNIRRLKLLGYSEIVLVGHSAGGLIARQFVEDYPDCGVTKVVQVCTPNLGASMAELLSGVPKTQRLFLHSLTKEDRSRCLKDRVDKHIPDNIEFVCVVGDCTGFGDLLVSKLSQWPKDLQDQGIPAVPVKTAHFIVMRAEATVQRLADIVRERQPRWSASRVATIRKQLGEPN